MQSGFVFNLHPVKVSPCEEDLQENLLSVEFKIIRGAFLTFSKHHSEPAQQMRARICTCV